MIYLFVPFANIATKITQLKLQTHKTQMFLKWNHSVCIQSIILTQKKKLSFSQWLNVNSMNMNLIIRIIPHNIQIISTISTNTYKTKVLISMHWQTDMPAIMVLNKVACDNLTLILWNSRTVKSQMSSIIYTNQNPPIISIRYLKNVLAFATVVNH